MKDPIIKKPKTNCRNLVLFMLTNCMRFNFSFYILTSCFVIGLATQLHAQNENKNRLKDSLVVGIAGSEPFVSQNKITKKPEGIAVEIWQNLADKNDINYQYKRYPTVEKALNAVEAGKIDLVVGPISITSQRLKHLQFSQPYYQSSLAIASRNDNVGFWSRIKPLFSMKLLIAVGVFLFILAIVGTLFWFAERKANPEQFPADPKRGIGNGMWLAIVTMSTTGYGDMAPVTLRGRIVAGSWMVITLIFATSMVAGIASTLTLSGLGTATVTNIEQLSEKKTATITGSPAVAFIKEHKAKSVTVNTLNEAMTLLRNKKVDAVIYDRPQLLYFEKNHKDDDLYIAKAEYYKQGYGFAFQKDNNLVYQVNLALLELAEDQKVAEITADYLGSQD